MTTATAPTTLSIQTGSSGRVYVLDGRKVVYTARSLAEAEEVIYGPEGYEGPTCSICDGLGHGYPGGRPCPLEDRGWDDDGSDTRWMGR